MSLIQKKLKLFSRILDSNIKEIKEDSIHSSGYFLHTLEASIWCLLNTQNYAEAVLKAVNLGGGTDTTGCVTGGLAVLLYGYDEILQVWINKVARREDIDELSNRLFKRIKQ
jgi:ADP-ribosylglycohydrolase